VYTDILPSRRKTELAAKSQLRPSARAICCEAFGSAGKPPPRDFFLKSPPTERISANAVTDRTLRRQSCARGCCCANAATRMPAVFACLLFAWSDHDIAQCSVLIEGRATVVTPALPWFHQRHRSRAARAPLFVRCSPLSSPHCASRYPCSQALSPAACCRFH